MNSLFQAPFRDSEAAVLQLHRDTSGALPALLRALRSLTAAEFCGEFITGTGARPVPVEAAAPHAVNKCTSCISQENNSTDSPFWRRACDSHTNGGQPVPLTCREMTPAPRCYSYAKMPFVP